MDAKSCCGYDFIANSFMTGKTIVNSVGEHHHKCKKLSFAHLIFTVGNSPGRSLNNSYLFSLFLKFCGGFWLSTYIKPADKKGLAITKPVGFRWNRTTDAVAHAMKQSMHVFRFGGTEGGKPLLLDCSDHY